MAWEGDEEKAVEQIRAELRRGGRPAQVYLELGGDDLPHDVARALTTAIILNQEDRVVAIEEWIDRTEKIELRARLTVEHETDGHDGWVRGCPTCEENERVAVKAMGE